MPRTVSIARGSVKGTEFELEAGLSLEVEKFERKNSNDNDGSLQYHCLMSTKDILLEIANKLPADATLADALYELEFRSAVEQGLAELDRGEGIPLDQLKKRLPQWLGK